MESVIAVLEVKTSLGKEELRRAVKAAGRIKSMPKSLRPTSKDMAAWSPRLMYYVVAYVGYETLKGLHASIHEVQVEQNSGQLPCSCHAAWAPGRTAASVRILNVGTGDDGHHPSSRRRFRTCTDVTAQLAPEYVRRSLIAFMPYAAGRV